MKFKLFSILLVSQIFVLLFLRYITRNTTDHIVYVSDSVKSVGKTTVASTVLGYNPDPNGEIDVVYTWVNGSDPIFVRNLNQYLSQINGVSETDVSMVRYYDKEELRYSLRSVEKYAPWYRKVFIVTNGQIPKWLNLSYEKVQIVTHDQIFENKSALPTFSSHAIEVNLHRIPGLAKQFIYLNDDVLFGAPTKRQDFISDDGKFILYNGHKLLDCGPKCFWNLLANKRCDQSCNTAECQFDGGDCEKVTTKEIGTTRMKRSVKTVPTYREALKSTNRILNNRYGFKERYSAAHGPIMYDVNIANEMRKVFGNEIKETEKNKVRQTSDCQVSLLYNSFLKEEHFNIEDIFNYFDRDQTGVWEESEWSAVNVSVQDQLKRCSVDTKVNLTIVNKCEPLLRALTDEYGTRNKYNYIVKKTSSYILEFVKVRTLAKLKQDLSRVKKNPKKFICINDNLDTRADNQIVLNYLREFYTSMFPMLSKFELPDNTTNKFLHVDEIPKI